MIGYHAQEYRKGTILDVPIRCDAENAWLGNGYYFWRDIEFAKYWGEDFKKRNTGYYTIYKADIDIEKFLDTTFSNEHYDFFVRCIEKTLDHFSNEGIDVTLKRVHDFLLEKFWNKYGVLGIIYDDLPSNPKKKLERQYSTIKHSEKEPNAFFYYKKRIQIVAFNLREVTNFAPHLTKQS